MNLRQTVKKIASHKDTLFIGLVVVLFIAITTALIVITIRQEKNRAANTPLTQEQLAKVIKPSVVRIIQHEKGTLSIPDFNFDFKNFTFSASSEKPQVKEIDNYLSGSGSIITPDGYIITNSHVVSKRTLAQNLIEQAATDLAGEKTYSLSDADYYTYFPNDSAYQQFIEKITEYLSENSTLKVVQEITVLNPGVNKRYLEDILDAGFPATVINVNDDFALDQRDAAVIKINQSNLPSLKLSTDNKVSVGDKIYIFGFPASGEFNDQNFSEATLTTGLVSAAKFSDDTNFKVYQTDAKISEGSSGGPMFNDKGEVIGLVTFETGIDARQTGDNFAFAIPISIANEILAKKNISNSGGDYAEHLRPALQLINRRECKAAIQELNISKTSNKFFATEQYIQPYLEQCKEIIAAGNSLDSNFAIFISELKNTSTLAWFVILGRVFLALIVGLVFWVLIERIHRNEKEIGRLEDEIDEVENSKKTIETMETPLPLPEEGVYHFSSPEGAPLPHPDLISYIKEARAVGMNDELIITDLQKAGWDDNKINSALHSI
jgi:S1-C subfamily serine protease